MSRARLHRLIFSRVFGRDAGVPGPLSPLKTGNRVDRNHSDPLAVLKASDFSPLRAEKRAGPRLHLHRDRSGEQLHSTEERALRGMVHGLHPPRAAAEGLADAAAPTRGPFHEAATQGAAAGPPEPPPSFRLHPLPFQSKD